MVSDLDIARGLPGSPVCVQPCTHLRGEEAVLQLLLLLSLPCSPQTILPCQAPGPPGLLAQQCPRLVSKGGLAGVPSSRQVSASFSKPQNHSSFGNMAMLNIPDCELPLAIRKVSW